MEDSDFVSHHQFLPRAAWDSIIPIGMHGDGGGFNKHDSLYTFTWNSLLAPGATIQTRFLFTVIRKSEMVADRMDCLMQAFAWLCNVMDSSETPFQSWTGTELVGGGETLAGGYRACLTQVRGDWEFYTTLFYFPIWQSAVRMCPFCRNNCRPPLDRLSQSRMVATYDLVA